MSYVVLVAWLIQAAVGLALLRPWLSTGRGIPVAVVAHALSSVTAVGFWVAFVATGRVAWGWIAFVLITIGNSFGDYVLVGRSRRLAGTRSSFFGDYRAAIGATLKGRLPKPVTFHALFAGVVYFGTLAVCIAETVS
jgi:hypothetical protein